MALSSIFIVSLMVFGLSIVAINSEDSSATVSGEWTYGSYEITIGDTTETYTLITAYSGSATSVILPSELDGVTIDGIGTSVNSSSYAVFYGKTTLTSVIIPDTYKIIGCMVFSGCTGLTSIDLPDSCTYIGSQAFYNCSGFTGSLTLPDSCTYIGSQAFYYCSGFTGSLTLPDSCTYIGSQAFCNCSGFTGSLTLPDSCTYIGKSAFLSCSGFTGSLTLPDSCTYIGSSAFQSCSGFTKYDASLSERLSYEDSFPFSYYSAADSEVKMNVSSVCLAQSVSTSYTIVWVANVHFSYLNGTSENIVTCTVDSTCSEPTAPTRSGYSFAGWVDSDGNDFDFTSAIISNIYLYASWIPESQPSFTVTFNANGGTNTISSELVNSGDEAIEPRSPVKDGFVFTNWYTSSALTTVFDFTSAITSNIILYAGYTEVISTPSTPSDDNGNDDSEESNYFISFVIIVFLIFVGCIVLRRH